MFSKNIIVSNRPFSPQNIIPLPEVTFVTSHCSGVGRNERERQRVKDVNEGFERLKSYLPETNNGNGRFSKIDILHKAICYIRYLEALLRYYEDREL